MKRILFIVLSVYSIIGYSQCVNCPSGTTAPGAAASPTTRFNGYTSEVNKYDGTTPTCYTPTANTLNGHLQGINLKLCSIKSTLDSLRAYDANNTIRLDSIINAMDSSAIDIDVRLDSIILALEQFYNTVIVSSDNSLNVSVDTIGNEVTYDLTVENDSVAVTTGNGMTGNGKPYNPIKLGGTVTENTTLTGDKDLNFNIRKGYFTNKYDTIQSNLLLAEYTSKYNDLTDFVSSDIGVRLTTIRDVRNGTWNLSTYQVNPTSTALTTDLKMTSGAILLKTGDTSAIPGWGDVTNVGMGFEAQNTTGGHITSAVNLALSAVYKGANSLPCTIYRYTSLAIGDLNRSTDSWIVPTERYAIYQEGETDKSVFMGYFMLPNLTSYANDAAALADTDLPTGAAYLITGSTVLHIKP